MLDLEAYEADMRLINTYSRLTNLNALGKLEPAHNNRFLILTKQIMSK